MKANAKRDDAQREKKRNNLAIADDVDNDIEN